MKTQIVYVLTSTNKDIYLEQAYASMYSLKYYMPEAHIILLVDKETEKTFIGLRKEEIKYADEIVTIDLDAKKYNGQKRSRILKTSVRKYIKGDFLFIDCDTIITRPLDDIEKIDAEIAACWDTHSLFKDNPYRNLCVRHAQILGWDVEQEEEYFNSGVIYVKDTPLAHQFYKQWNQNWFEGEKKGVNMDQPAFALTNSQMGHVVKTLPDVWNCELKHGVKFLKDAIIVHCLCTSISNGKHEQFFIMNDNRELLKIKETGELTPEIIKTIEDPFYGIARLTHCFAGEDVYYFRTYGHNFLRKKYHWESFNDTDQKVKQIENLLNKKNKIIAIFKKLKLT